MICPLTLEIYPFELEVRGYPIFRNNEFDERLWKHDVEYIINYFKGYYYFKTEEDRSVAALLL